MTDNSSQNSKIQNNGMSTRQENQAYYSILQPQQKKRKAKGKKKVKDLLSQSRKKMLSTASKTIQNLSKDIFIFQNNSCSQQTRKQNCYHILKYLIYGYLELQQQTSKKIIFKQQSSICRKTRFFLEQSSTLQKSLPLLIQKSKQIQRKIEYYHSIQNGKLSNKYRIKIKNLLLHLSDLQNQRFREEILNDTYDANIVAAMDEIDMMESNKRKCILNKQSNELQLEQIKENKKIRHQNYLRMIQKSHQYQVGERQKNEDHKYSKLVYFLSPEFVQDLEIQLMQIPSKIIRKAALHNLKKIFA